MKFVFICSPLRGDVETNIRRANGYCRFALTEGVLPIAPHVIFSKVLDDGIPEERALGLKLSRELLAKVCSEIWVFGDRISEGMRAEIELAQELDIPIQYFTSRCERR